MKFADEAIKSRATRRSNSTWSSSGSASCPAGKVERRLVMIGVRLPEEGGPVGTIFTPASFGNLLPELAGFNSPRRLLRRVFRGDDRNYRAEHLLLHNFHLLAAIGKHRRFVEPSFAPIPTSNITLEPPNPQRADTYRQNSR